MKHLIPLALTAALIFAALSGCGATPAQNSTTPETAGTTVSETDAPTEIQISDTDMVIMLSETGITTENIPDGAVFTSNDIIYYEDRDTYESGHAYGEGEKADKHSADAASAHTVVNIAAPGEYRITGTLPLGQIRVDLGEDAFTDPNAKVTLVLDNADITCEVAPAILFLNVYECDNEWDADTAQSQVDTLSAGANILLAPGSENNITGSHVAKIYKDDGNEKKLWKQDGAVYSYMSMNISGDDSSTMNITADNEGLDTELHLTINGGNLNIRSGNDGINTNEDGVSVTTINGGNLHIIAGLGEEGDGIDSNGWLVINGGTVVAAANPASDAGLDSDMGSYINGGTVIALGASMDWAESDSDQVTMNLQFAEYKDSGDAIIVTREDGTPVFAYDPSCDEILGENTRRYRGAILSFPGLSVGDALQIHIGGAVEGNETTGIYDISTVTNFSGSILQAYTGTDVTMGFGRPGGGRGGQGDFDGDRGNGHPGGFGGRGDAPTPPEGEIPSMPEGEMPAMPEGEMPTMPEGEMPAMPEGEMPAMPEGGFAPDAIDPMGISPEGGNTLFYMQDKVNFFSGITNAS